MEIYNHSIDRNLIHRWLYYISFALPNILILAQFAPQKHKILQLDAGPDKYHAAGPAKLQQRLWWRLRRGCSADTGGPYWGYGCVNSYWNYGWEERGGVGLSSGLDLCKIFKFQPPQQCPVIVNQRQGVGQGGVDLRQGDVDLHQGGGVIKRAKSFSRPRSISPNPLR